MTSFGKIGLNDTIYINKNNFICGGKNPINRYIYTDTKCLRKAIERSCPTEIY